MINLKKLFSYLFLIVINFFFITFIFFSFSYLSLVKGKTYDFFWVKSIQKTIYNRGLRNIWQHSPNCVEFSQELLYAPKDGKCKFSNPEFETVLTFKNQVRNNMNMFETDKKNSILILGDSLSMGWGVNDNETFASLLETFTNRKVYNLAVSSYGTIRELKKFNKFKNLSHVSTVILQYHHNDIQENLRLDPNKVYKEKEFKSIFEINNIENKTFFLLRNFKTSFRLFFSDLKTILLNKKYTHSINFQEHQIILEKLLKQNKILSQKEVIILYVGEPSTQILNFPKDKNYFKYLLIQPSKDKYFIIDDHLNPNGHELVAKKITQYLGY